MKYLRNSIPQGVLYLICVTIQSHVNYGIWMLNARMHKDICNVSVVWQQGLTGSGGADMEINVGDILKLKKPHPCGSHEWEVLRVGADFRIKCRGCGHQVMIARRLLEKNIKEIL